MRPQLSDNKKSNFKITKTFNKTWKSNQQFSYSFRCFRATNKNKIECKFLLMLRLLFHALFLFCKRDDENGKKSELFANSLDPLTHGEAAQNVVKQSEARKAALNSTLPAFDRAFKLV